MTTAGPGEAIDPPAGDGGGASALVWREVLRAIYAGRFAPGQRLTEAELTKAYGVSRSSVREALSRLAAEGVVVLERHKGAVVRRASKAELLDILAVLDSLIVLGARLAAGAIERPGAREAASEFLAKITADKPRLAGFDLARERNRFYRLLMQLAGNEELRRLMTQVHVHPLRIRLSERRTDAELFGDYARILEAVMAGDEAAAAAAAHEHVAANAREIGASTDWAPTPERRTKGR